MQSRPKLSTCIVVFVRLDNLVDKSDADLAEKVHEERSVEVFAQLVENKPGKEKQGFDTSWELQQPSPVAKFCGFHEGLDRLNLG